jgi:hypothetical protein
VPKSSYKLVSLYLTWHYLRLSSRPFLDLFFVGRVAFDAELDLLEATLAQNQLGHIPVLNVPEKPV